MTELDKLEQYLIDKKIPHTREDRDGVYDERGFVLSRDWHQIRVFGKDGEQRWDAICHRYSYGYEQGLLEIMGDIVPMEVEDSVEGYLTAEDVIKRMEAKENA